MILITGATGLVGGLLLEQLCFDDQKVIALYRSDYRKNQLLNAWAKKYTSQSAVFENIQWVHATLTDLGALETAFEKATYVYHCAAQVELTDQNAAKMILTNVTGTANVVNLCLKYRIKKLAFVSSIAALGKETSSGTINEETLWSNDAPQAAYNYSKYQSTLEVWRGAQEGLDVVIVHPGVILGYNHRTGPIKKAFDYIQKKSYYYTKGITGFVTNADVVKALRMLMESPIKNESYVLVSENISYKEFFERLAKANKINNSGRLIQKSILSTLWAMDAFLANLKLKRKTLSRGLVNLLYENHQYDGQKIKTDLPNFEYASIDTVLVKP